MSKFTIRIPEDQKKKIICQLVDLFGHLFNCSEINNEILTKVEADFRIMDYPELQPYLENTKHNDELERMRAFLRSFMSKSTFQLAAFLNILCNLKTCELQSNKFRAVIQTNFSDLIVIEHDSKIPLVEDALNVKRNATHFELFRTATPHCSISSAGENMYNSTTEGTYHQTVEGIADDPAECCSKLDANEQKFPGHSNASEVLPENKRNAEKESLVPKQCHQNNAQQIQIWRHWSKNQKILAVILSTMVFLLIALAIFFIAKTNSNSDALIKFDNELRSSTDTAPTAAESPLQVQDGIVNVHRRFVNDTGLHQHTFIDEDK